MRTVSPTMSNIDFLNMAETRLRNVKLFMPNSNEVERLEFVRNDIFSKLTPTESLEYLIASTAVEDAATAEANRLAQVKQMNENRDRPSI